MITVQKLGNPFSEWIRLQRKFNPDQVLAWLAEVIRGSDDFDITTREHSRLPAINSFNLPRTAHPSSFKFKAIIIV